MTRLGPAIERVLERGGLCHLSARTAHGPHLTPAVFAMSGGSLWATTSRVSVKARAWRGDPAVAGLVRVDGEAVSFGGRVRPYDLLDAGTWPDVVVRAPAVTAASIRFSRKNARFFAGYAVDARHVPLAWTPPGRVFVEIRIDWAVLLRAGAVIERAGSPAAPAAPATPGAPVAPGRAVASPEARSRAAPSRAEASRAARSRAAPSRAEASRAVPSRAAYRSVASADAFAALPGRARDALGDGGEGALALEAPHPIVLPVRWAAGDGPILAAAPVEALALAGVGPSARAAIAIDRATWWRARRMLGCMVQGPADVFVPAAVRSGARALASAIDRTGGDAERDALARLRPERVVWWEGWTSASARVA